MVGQVAKEEAGYKLCRVKKILRGTKLGRCVFGVLMVWWFGVMKWDPFFRGEQARQMSADFEGFPLFSQMLMAQRS